MNLNSSSVVYSAELAPVDYYLFPKIKRELSGCQVECDDDIFAAENQFLGI